MGDFFNTTLSLFPNFLPGNESSLGMTPKAQGGSVTNKKDSNPNPLRLNDVTYDEWKRGIEEANAARLVRGQTSPLRYTLKTCPYAAATTAVLPYALALFQGRESDHAGSRYQELRTSTHILAVSNLAIGVVTYMIGRDMDQGKVNPEFALNNPAAYMAGICGASVGLGLTDTYLNAKTSDNLNGPHYPGYPQLLWVDHIGEQDQ